MDPSRHAPSMTPLDEGVEPPRLCRLCTANDDDALLGVYGSVLAHDSAAADGGSEIA